MDDLKLTRDLDNNVFNSKNRSLPNIDIKEFFEEPPIISNNKPIKTTIPVKNNIFEMIIIIVLFVLLNTRFTIHFIYYLLELNPHSHYYINLIFRTFVFSGTIYFLQCYLFT
jgi:hypothetical protein